jgi:hypothetical protein
VRSPAAILGPRCRQIQPARLRGLGSDLIDPSIAAHRGRVVKRTAGGVISELPCVLDSARCAVEVQTGMVGRNADVPAEHLDRVAPLDLHQACGLPHEDFVLGRLASSTTEIAALDQLELVLHPGLALTDVVLPWAVWGLGRGHQTLPRAGAGP